MSVSRSSVLLVGGTRLNTRRSPSVMRLVSTGWRWPGTAEMPAMRWPVPFMSTGKPTEWCSVLVTATMIYGRSASAPASAAGGFIGAAQVTSTHPTVFGWPTPTSATCKPLTWWWNSTSNPADRGGSSPKEVWDIFSVLRNRKKFELHIGLHLKPIISRDANYEIRRNEARRAVSESVVLGRGQWTPPD